MSVSLKICIYTFSTTAYFFRALIEHCNARGDDVEWSAIFPQGHFRHLFGEIVPLDHQCYLYQRFSDVYHAVNDRQIEHAFSSGEGVVTALLKDKSGYRWLDKDEQIKRATAIFTRYRDFLAQVRPDFVLFPDLETVDGFLAMNVCMTLKIPVLYYTETRAIGVSFFGPDPYETLPRYFGGQTENDRATARTVVEKFRQRRNNRPGSNYPPNPPTRPSWFRRFFVSEYIHWRYERLHSSEYDYGERIKHNLLPFVRWLRRQRFDKFAKRYFDLRPVDESPPDRYIYFALHYTPESSINGLEPYYVDQFRVIDALLLSLPTDHRLVVKEHPAMYGMRPASFYRALRRRPGVVIGHPALDSRRLIERASLVATVSGTVGLEAYFLDRPCLLFGRSFFAHLCYRAPAMHELKPYVSKILAEHSPPTPDQKEIEIAKLVNIGADFAIGDPWFNPTVMAQENVQAVREYLWRHLVRLGIAVQ